jgi:hypothetical protein
MKKHLLFKMLAVLIVLITSINTTWATISQRIVFLDPGNNWREASAYFDVHYWQSSNTSNNGDVTMTESNNSGVYYAYIPDWADRVQFVRRNPSGGGEWARTSDQTLQNWYGQLNITGWCSSYSWDNTVWWNTYTIYYDDTETKFTSGVSTPKLRVGTTANTTKDDMTLVTGTKALYKKTKSGGNWDGYHAFCFANAAGATGSSSIYNRGSGSYNITKQTEYIRGSLKGDFTFIGHSAGSYYHNDDKCWYYSTEIYYGVKKYTITNNTVEHATVELYYIDTDGTRKIVTEGNFAQVLPTTRVWCKVTPDAGYSLSHVNLYDPTVREWTDASREDGDYEQNCYVVRTNVTFEAVMEPYATKTILVKDINSWAPNMYFKGWNPFTYEGYDNSRYHYATQKVSDKIRLCGSDYYVVTISNEFPFYYIHNENDVSRTAFFATNRLTHMAKYNDNTAGDGKWGLVKADCADMIYWVETHKGSGPTYISNIVSNTTDTLSFHVESGGTVDFHAGSADAEDQYSSLFATYFNSGQALYGKTGGVFTATPNAGGTGLANVAIFDGDYRIHVDATTRNYLTNGASKAGTTGTKFTKFAKSATFKDTYDHYWVDWFLGNDDGYGEQSVVASVGNIYNSNLAGILGADAFAPKGKTQEAGGNVRYGYDPETNAFTRSMLSGNGDLIKISAPVEGTVIITDGGGETDAYTTPCSFDDATNWVYTLDADVKGQAHATVTSEYNGITYTLSDDAQLLGGSSATTYEVEISYDFKTNRVLGAWMPKSGEAITGFSLESNLMVVRREDETPTVLNITGTDNKVTNINKIYTTFELWQDSWLDASAPYDYANRRIVSGSYKDEYYWFSLPYKCYMGDVFGIEGYGPNGSWVIMTYHGDYRARDGWWAETENWWYYLDRTDTLQANQGYVLRVTNLNGEGGMVKRFAGESGGKLYLYFPSYEENLSIKEIGSSTTTTVPEHICTKVRDEANHAGDPNYDRRAIDSNWNIIGSPSFNTATLKNTDFSTSPYPTEDVTGTLKYFFTWSAAKAGTNKYTIQDAADYQFQALSAYLVQYAGTINWQAGTGTNPLVGITKAPLRSQEESGEQTLRLVLNENGQQSDVAYISRLAEGATEGYDLNMDLSKMMNAKQANLYTISGYYKMAGNCIPDTVKTLKVGVRIAADGEYTFSLPEGTQGTGIVLLDNVAGTHTNLALEDYTVNLAAGTYDERFVLQFSPIAQTPTGIENTNDSEKGHIRKVMVDGILYIVKDGKAFDAQGNRVK